MHAHDIRHITDENLMMILRSTANESTKHAAADELLRRGSRYVNAPEFAPYQQTTQELAENPMDADALLAAMQIGAQVGKAARVIVLWLAALSVLNITAILAHFIRR